MQRHPLAEEAVTVAAATVSLGSRHLRLSSPNSKWDNAKNTDDKEPSRTNCSQVQITANRPISLALESVLALQAPSREVPHQREGVILHLVSTDTEVGGAPCYCRAEAAGLTPC